MTARPLAARRVVVTRASEQAGELSSALAALGAEVVDAPTITVGDPDDGGLALRAALARLGDYDWLVVTSPNGARRVLAAAPPDRLLGARIAVVGPGTAAEFAAAGVHPALVPDRFVAEGLLAAFPEPPPGGGRVLLAQARDARAVLAHGLRAAGWDLETVVAYVTVPVVADATTREAVASADAVTFASGSAVAAFVAGYGLGAVPPIVVCIGPVTADAAASAGIAVAAVADPHTIDGLVSAVVDALAPP
jgi:uroporphyrinogen-III synthase